MNQYIRQFITPVVNVLIRKIRQSKKKEIESGWFGDFLTWDDALMESGKYDDAIIFEKVKEATLKVINGEGAFERDSVIFEKLEYSWPLLGCLLKVAAPNNKLRIIDFGGSLGSSFIQHKSFLDHLDYFEWNVVEQKHFVEFGQSNIKIKGLFFHDSIQKIEKLGDIDCIIFSSVLQYLREPQEIIKLVNDSKIKYVIIDKTAIIQSDKSRITVQKVPEHIYSASYPTRFFSEKELLDMFVNYDLIIDFPSFECMKIALGSEIGIYKGYILKYEG